MIYQYSDQFRDENLKNVNGRKHVSSKRKLKRLKNIFPIFDLNISSERHFQKIKAPKIITTALSNTRVREGGRQKWYFFIVLSIEIKCALYTNI